MNADAYETIEIAQLPSRRQPGCSAHAYSESALHEVGTPLQLRSMLQPLCELHELASISEQDRAEPAQYPLLPLGDQ